jgi:hypothetical protein
VAGTARSRREQVITGVAAALILGLALWLLLGRSPGTGRVEVGLGRPVTTNAGVVTVLGLDRVQPGTAGAPAPTRNHIVMAIRFRSCRSGPDGPVVNLRLFGVRTAHELSPVAGSDTSETPAGCDSGVVYSQVPAGFPPSAVEYDADPVAVWTIPDP